jgi:polar amino acid transport system substrate-binding protein
MKGIVIFLILISTSVFAEPLKIATGEYAPYSGEDIPGLGISTKIVKTVFQEINQDIVIEFMPWNRVMNNLKSARISGSFPWTKNDEREIDMLYSEPINELNIFLFKKKNKSFPNDDLTKKTMCIPSGWDLLVYTEVTEKFNVKITRPVDLESCMRMLAKDRVDFLLISEKVGKNAIEKQFGKDSLIEGTPIKYFTKKINLYFIIPKKYPHAKKLLQDFNMGLAKIKINGIYDKIVEK